MPNDRQTLAPDDMPGSRGPVAGRYTVRSVARALRLVGAVAEGPAEGRSLSDLARELGTSKSTTLALARTLSAFGYLREATHGRGYTLGTALIRLGDIAGQQIPLRDLCRPLIDELSRETKMTARAAVNDDGYPVFIDRVDGPGTVRFHTPLGQREVPYASAAGKAILAAWTRPGCARSARTGPAAPDRAHDHRHRLAARQPGGGPPPRVRGRRRGGRRGRHLRRRGLLRARRHVRRRGQRHRNQRGPAGLAGR